MKRGDGTDKRGDGTDDRGESEELKEEKAIRCQGGDGEEACDWNREVETADRVKEEQFPTSFPFLSFPSFLPKAEMIGTSLTGWLT